tara:strand:- start:11 stop:202 length:192 start_codon:yes stop_codon:yes gene_type:complete
MNITSAQYQHLHNGDGSIDEENYCILAVIDNIPSCVPLDPDNRHYAAILKWAEEDGNTIQEAD